VIPSEPYELLITSASRPHLLRPTLESLLRRVEVLPQRVVVHDDAVFSGRKGAVNAAVVEAYTAVFGTDMTGWPVTLMHFADPPRRLGPALAWLMTQAQTPFALYSQDDFVAVRAIPIGRALDVMLVHALHHIRFNKRATMAVKDTWTGPWRKEERDFVMLGQGDTSYTQRLTISDHWYFQLGLMRVAELRAALVFWTSTQERLERLAWREPETLINHYFDRVRYGDAFDARHPRTRAQVQRTFIWGPIGEDRYVRHIGGDPGDWASDHPRYGVDSAARAWEEIASYPGPHPTPTR
jgi:hypothetical protein